MQRLGNSSTNQWQCPLVLNNHLKQEFPFNLVLLAPQADFLFYFFIFFEGCASAERVVIVPITSLNDCKHVPDLAKV